jgi:ribosomal protein S18 acetylase RimI-like enzyme
VAKTARSIDLVPYRRQNADMFSSPDLAARIDRAEGRFCAAIAHEIDDARVVAIGGGVAVLAARESPSNKMIGIGFDGCLDEAALSDVEKHFAARGARLQAEVSTLADPAVHQQLVQRGYVPSGFENVLGHGLQLGVVEPLGGVAVERLSPRDLPALADVMAEGFATPDVGGVGGDAIPAPDEIRRWFAFTMRVPGCRGYIARIGGAIVGGAALRLDDGVAQFSGAATLPQFRRRGVQTVLLRARLADAAVAGCNVAVVVTQPASKSQQNVQREGFALLYARQLLVKPRPDA